ncbi:MAG: Gfo/Idh/MocA family protein [Chloroflexota bacterium]
MSTQAIRVGVIGAGRFAEQAHIPGVQAHPDGQVVALCARNRERASALAARFGVPRVYTDYQELLAQPDIGAVTIAAPDALHLPVALAALAAGKHVFCEKPLAMDAGEARRLVAAGQQAGLVNMVAFTFRYTRALLAMRRLIQEGTLGTPFAVSMQVHWGGVGFPRGSLSWRETAEASAAGIWGDGASHLFDALAYLLAPAEEVCAQMQIVPREPGTEQPESVDHATCLARLHLHAQAAAGQASAFSDREAGTVHASLLTSRVDTPYGNGDEIQVVGTNGAVNGALNRGARERLSLRRAGGRAWEEVSLPPDASTDEPRALTRMLGAFVDAVQRGRPDPDQDPDFRAGLHAQEAIDAATRSARHNRWETVRSVERAR